MKHLLTHTLLALLAFAIVPMANAANGHGSRDRDRIVLAAGEISLDQAVAMVERRFKAKVVRTEVRQDGDRKIYVLRLLNDEGRVWSVRVDASSGSVQ